MKKSFYVISLIIFFIVNSCVPFNAYLYIIPDQKDIKRFKHEVVKHDDTCFTFQKKFPNKNFTITNWVYSTPLQSSSLEDFLIKTEAQHFLIIKSDTIVFEFHDKKQKLNQPIPSFSIAKVLVSACLGKAIEEGYMKSTNELVKNYIPEFNYHENFNTLTIDHLINQKSGIRIEVDDISDTYYGKIEKILDEIHFVDKPGLRFEYVNVNTILLGICIERATGKDLHAYFSDKIWSKIGTCDSTVWAYDYQTHHTRSYCCFGTSTIDYAKFGRLYLNKGKWGDEQIIDSNWVNLTTHYRNSLGEEVGYNNYWFIGDKRIGDYLALGMYRQQVYVNPKNNVIIVGFFEFNGNNLPMRWWQLLRQLADQA